MAAALLAAIVSLYLAIGVLYAVHTPAWQSPDEPAHYNYIAHIVQARALPVLQPGDYDQAYLDRLKAERFPSHLPVDSVRYEAWQPPLYYLLAAPVYAAFGGSLLAVRLFSLTLGAGIIFVIYAIGRALFPRQPVIAVTAAGFAAFVPQHLAIMASANNDPLAELLLGLGMLLSVRLVLAPPAANGRATYCPLSLVLGLAFLSKASAYPLAAVAALALLLLARRQSWTARQLLRAGLQVFAPALLLGGLWWGRNIAVYGWPDFLGLARHDEIVVGQLRTADALAQWGSAAYARAFFQTTFQSFWGQFGWMGVPMDSRVYLALLAYSLLLTVGAAGALAAALRAPRARRARQQPRLDALTLLAVSGLLALAVYLYYNLTYVQHQGRYLFPALPAIALAASVGLRQWALWLLALARQSAGSSPRAQLALWLLPLAAIAAMAALSLFALYRFIIPALT